MPHDATTRACVAALRHYGPMTVAQVCRVTAASAASVIEAARKSGGIFSVREERGRDCLAWSIRLDRPDAIEPEPPFALGADVGPGQRYRSRFAR